MVKEIASGVILIAVLGGLCARAQQPVSPTMARLAGRYEAIFEADAWVKAVTRDGTPTPAQLRAKEQMNAVIDRLIVVESRNKSPYAWGDNNLRQALDMAYLTSYEFLLGAYFGMAPDKTMEQQAASCYTVEHVGRTTRKFPGWHFTAEANAICLDLPDDASPHDVIAAVRAYVDERLEFAVSNEKAAEQHLNASH